MVRRAESGEPEKLRIKLIELLNDFEGHLKEEDLRKQVQALVPTIHIIRDLGSSLVADESVTSARDRILYYLCRYAGTVVPGDELAVVSGISEYARRIRELRVEHGWPIYSGKTAKEMIEEEMLDGYGDLFGPEFPTSDIRSMNTDDYILLGEQDEDAASRWQIANEIRKEEISIRDGLLKYLRTNVAKPVTGEELRYVAKGKQSWPRRTRELRTEEGWPVATKNSGRPDLPVGVYILEADRQSLPHDRNIPDSVRVAVLERDEFKCQCCGWYPGKQRKGDPRALLELHHIEHHAEGGSNESENLITLCNVHHDDVHTNKLNGREEFSEWITKNCRRGSHNKLSFT